MGLGTSRSNVWAQFIAPLGHSMPCPKFPIVHLGSKSKQMGYPLDSGDPKM